MNFYIGNSLEEINMADANVEFNDELLAFIYKLSKQVSFNMSKLLIDPYEDVEISKNDLPQIIEICNYLIEKSLLLNYGEDGEGNKALQDLVEIARNAMARGLGLVSIGD